LTPIVKIEAFSDVEPKFDISRDERRWVTVLFADVSGFTSLAERMDPEEVKILANRCMERLGEEAIRFGGKVVSVAGDEVMVVFGAPLAHEDDAERAVRAGLAMRDGELSDDPNLPVQVHVGINTGEVMAGLLGPKARRDYTVIGDTTNTAARLLKAAPGGHVYVGIETYRATRHIIDYRELQPIEAKGKRDPVLVWEALSAFNMPQARLLGAAPLIGRDEELNQLLHTWARVTRDTQPHLVTLLSEPGIGKSRLVSEFECRISGEVTIWHGRCLPYGEAFGYWALAMALKEAAGIVAEDDAETARGKLGNLVAQVTESEGEALEVARHLALLSGLDMERDRLPGSSDQRLLHASARRFFEHFSRRHALCVVLDDIHWADMALLDLIESIAGRAREAPLFILTMARPELMEKRPAWGRGVHSFTSIKLEPLNETAEHDLILALCSNHDLPIELAKAISRNTGGNPLFVEEMVAMIAERGSSAEIPSMIKMLIAARLDSFFLKERTTIQLAAVFGNTFWEGGLRALESHIAADLPETLDALEQKDLIRRIPQSLIRGDHEFVFKHDLIREVAYEMLPKEERRQLHSRAADWLEQASGGQVDNYLDQITYHVLRADQQERAINYLARASERSSYTGAHLQTAGLLAQAIAIAESLGQKTLASDLHARRGKAYLNVGLWAEARTELEAALAGLPDENAEQRALILIDLAVAVYWVNDTASGSQYSTEAMQIAKVIQRDDILAGALAALSSAHSSEGKFESKMELSRQAMELAGDQPIGAVTHGIAIRGLHYYWIGEYEQAIATAQLGVQMARKMNDTFFTSFSLPHAGLALAEMGKYTEAEQVFDEAKRYSREYDVRPMLTRAVAMSAGYHLDLYDFARHEAIAQEARQMARSVNILNPLVSTSLDLLYNYIRRGEVGQADRILKEVAETVEKAAGSHGWMWRLKLAEARAELALAHGDYEKALDLVQKAISQSQAYGRMKYQAYGLETHAKALAGLGRKKEAITQARAAVDLIRPIGAPALFLRAAVELINLDGDDELLAEAHATAQRIMAALPDDEMRQAFTAPEPVRAVMGR
jgi:class 3 adenylate cyclase/tetratricopeptide (TPR) repeat protein